MTPARMPLALSERDAERFWSKVRKLDGEDACWLWTGAWRGNGYGAFKAAGAVFDSHVFAWRITNGCVAIPDGQLVMHTCDVRPCVRPDHLTLGTSSDNMKDARDKGRLQEVWTYGEKAHNAVLTEALVRDIRTLKAEGLGYVRIARRLGVSKWAVRGVLKGRNWNHVK